MTNKKKDNPQNYNLDHDLVVAIWIALFQEDNQDLQKELSKIMIEQGCQGIYVEDTFLVFSFWKQYLEEYYPYVFGYVELH